MGKRKSESADEEYELFKRFKEFQRTFMRAQRKSREPTPPPQKPQPPPGSPPRSRSSSSSSSGSSSRSSSSSSAGRRSGRSSRGASRARDRSPSSEREPDQPGPDSAPADAGSQTRGPPHIQDVPYDDDTQQSLSAAAGCPPPPAPAATRAPPPPPPLGSCPLPTDESIVVASTELDDELLQILGDDPSKTKVTGKDIQTDLAVRLQHIATSGLTKEVRKELLDKYLPPGNCTLIDAPELNPEVKAAVSDTIYKRDKGIKTKQKQLASATSCLAEALTILLSSESRNMTLIKLLMDAAKLLCDTQNQDSVTRRNFVLYNLKKELKDQLQATKIDKYLFSQDLADTLKAAKAISKSGADMKVTPTPTQQPTKKTNKPAPNNLNWRAPPHSHKPKGTPRSKEPARKTQRDSSSKQSSRRPPTSGRSRQ